MPARLVALDEGSDIPLDRSMVVVGRHPLCDVRLDSLRISRHHCCMTQDNDEVVVRDLGSTNGIRINGQRVEIGRLRPGDELSIAHIRYRLENGVAHEMTLADPNGSLVNGSTPRRGPARRPRPARGRAAATSRWPRWSGMRLGGIPDKCRIQVIVQMKNDPRGRSVSAVSTDRIAPTRSERGPEAHVGPTRPRSMPAPPRSSPISRPVILIGRHPECDVRIDSPQISRRHCCVALAYDRLMIRDLGSRNGVRVNGRVVEETRPQPGDEVAIGHFLYRFEWPCPRPPRRRPPTRPAPRPPPIIDLDDDLIPLDRLIRPARRRPA